MKYATFGLRLIFCLIFCFYSFFNLFAQTTEISGTINWGTEQKWATNYDGSSFYEWPCTNCRASETQVGEPIFYFNTPTTVLGKVSAELIESNWQPISVPTGVELKEDFKSKGIEAATFKSRTNIAISGFLIPVRRSGQGYEVLTSYKIRLTLTPSPIVQNRGGNTTNSVLNSGENFKVSVVKSGIHKLDYNYFKNTLGLNPDDIDPRRIKVYGNGGSMLSEQVADSRPDDLIQNPIFVSGEEDGKFNSGDFVLFYAEGPHTVSLPSGKNLLTVTTNLYSNENYYFINYSSENGKRINLSQDNGPASYVTSSYQEVIRYEPEEVNLLDLDENGSGSGKLWFGDNFGGGSTKDYTSKFLIKNILTDQDATVKIVMASRSSATTNFKATIDGKNTTSNNIPASVVPNSSLYARAGSLTTTFKPSGGNVPLTLQYNAPAGSSAWLDYIEFNATCAINLKNSTILIADPNSIGNPYVQYRFIVGSDQPEVWKVTNLGNIEKMPVSDAGGFYSFISANTELNSFVAFNPNGNFVSPGFVQKLANQNLHGIQKTDMVIIYSKIFESEMLRLKSHREKVSGLTITAVDIPSIYNEFSSGKNDLTAIRDFCKMIYDRDPNFKYLLLFGDGTYDYKNNLKLDPFQNFIPVFETPESFNYISSYPSDDYYALLDNVEGGDLNGGMELAVGRLTVNNLEESKILVDKIIHYDTSPLGLKDWRLRALFSGDDEDSNTHVNDAEIISKSVVQSQPLYNLDKIYLDSYKLVPTPGGNRFPEATDAFNNAINKGALVVNYFGHGGPKGLAQERVISVPDILSWNNYDRMALLVTATCTFAGFDDQTVTSAGEYSILNSKGGAVALFSTVRPVYSTANRDLADAVFDTLFTRPFGQRVPMGEILRIGKNRFSSGTLTSFKLDNARKFAMLGDPSQFLAIPENFVSIDTINGFALNTFTDTINALDKVTLKGSILKQDGSFINNFTGKIYVTVFDKPKVFKTLAQQKDSKIQNYDLQKSVIFKGTASVINGKYVVSFIVPKDIDYSFGSGKISLYAENGTTDAAGFNNTVIIGGSGGLITENEPPIVKVYLNDENFVSGGLTNENPLLIANISDDLGINVSGSSIGHDLVAIIDENTENQIVLNEYYEAELNNFKKGKLAFSLENISEGKHTLRVKAWDITNNSGEGTTEFVVAKGGKASLSHVLNYPNPFTTKTSFQFEHNLGPNELTACVRIYSISGVLAKTIYHTTNGAGSRIPDINWDGKDDYGNDLAKGVYLYKITVNSISNGSDPTQKAESDFEKLVLLK